MRSCFAALTLALLLPAAHAQKPPHSNKLQIAIALPSAMTNGVAISDHDRRFLVLAKQPGQAVPQIAEYADSQLVPYPTAGWNDWHPGDDASQKFVHANSIRFDADGLLWVIDSGIPGFGKPPVKHGPKLVAINIKTAAVVRMLYLDNVTLPTSFVDDARFNGDHAYVTDAGAPGLIILHLPDGAAFRALDGDKSTTGLKAVSADGHPLRTPEGHPVILHADQLELSPDGKILYYQPLCGPMSSLETQYLDDATLTDAARRKHVQAFAETGSTGGTAIDAHGNLYVSDVDHNRILKITPVGRIFTVVEDPRLEWVDALWITADGKLWLPSAQLNRTADFNGGKSAIEFPTHVYTLDIGVGPPENDHP